MRSHQWCERGVSSSGQLVTGLTDGGCGNQFRTSSPGALSSGGCGLARPIVPGCATLLVCLVSILSIVVISAASIATLNTMAKMTKTAVRACRPAACSRSFFMDASLKEQVQTLHVQAGSAGLGS